MERINAFSENHIALQALRIADLEFLMEEALLCMVRSLVITPSPNLLTRHARLQGFWATDNVCFGGLCTTATFGMGTAEYPSTSFYAPDGFEGILVNFIYFSYYQSH